MFDRHQPRAFAPSPAGMAGAIRSTVSRWIGHGERAPACRPIRAYDDLGPPLTAGEWSGGHWMSPPPERPLPRDLDMPLSLFDPGAIRDWAAPPRTAALPDPVMLERTLHRLGAMMAR